jgi:multimeric flavodoxin WrbA
MKNGINGLGTKGKAIILDGSSEEDQEAGFAAESLHAELARSEIRFKHHFLRDMAIANCTGCLQCWTKSPGECVIDDEQWKINADMARSNIVVLITPVTFGGYSSELKKGMDRLIPVLLPFFRKYNGETHHPSRYGNEWNLFGVGTLAVHDEEKEFLFQDIVHRNSLNMHSKVTSSLILLHGLGCEEINSRVVTELRKVIL